MKVILKDLAHSKTNTYHLTSFNTQQNIYTQLKTIMNIQNNETLNEHSSRIEAFCLLYFMHQIPFPKRSRQHQFDFCKLLFDKMSYPELDWRASFQQQVKNRKSLFEIVLSPRKSLKPSDGLVLKYKSVRTADQYFEFV